MLMTLDELKDLVFIAIDKCQSIIERNSNAVLSESDFKDGYAILKKGKKVFHKMEQKGQ